MIFFSICIYKIWCFNIFSRAKELELEDRQARLETELRNKMSSDDGKRNTILFRWFVLKRRSRLGKYISTC